ncbi:expressed unknown protein [Seminavis robusta]|uniref:Glycerophosphoryl diester phosphodiesterase membrane domain-containing protein n=1 Tax=Seminavis robusta TaxID=568900 RepID=A0A9N8D935_9STRA|nr:expressed unknown protein [Seminavis robusta]|eukprot:Sro20_g014230.1 n/a (324) ;mRNA; r:116252-117298
MMKPTPPTGAGADRMFSVLEADRALMRAFDILFGSLARFCTFFALGLLYLPLLALVVAIISISQAGGQTPDDDQPSTGSLFVIALAAGLCAPVVFLAEAAIIRATAEVYCGEQPRLGSAVRLGIRNICRLYCFGFVLLVPLVGMALLGSALAVLVIGMMQQSDKAIHSVGIVLALALFPVWSIAYFYVMIPFQMAPPSLVLERSTTVAGVVGRVWELSRGRRCTIFPCTIFSATFLLATTNFLAGLIPLVNLFWNLLSLPLSCILATVLYLNLRVEKEGLTCAKLRMELGLDADGMELVMTEEENYLDEPEQCLEAGLVRRCR